MPAIAVIALRTRCVGTHARAAALSARHGPPARRRHDHWLGAEGHAQSGSLDHVEVIRPIADRDGGLERQRVLDREPRQGRQLDASRTLSS